MQVWHVLLDRRKSEVMIISFSSKLNIAAVKQGISLGLRLSQKGASSIFPCICSLINDCDWVLTFLNGQYLLQIWTRVAPFPAQPSFQLFLPFDLLVIWIVSSAINHPISFQVFVNRTTNRGIVILCGFFTPSPKSQNSFSRISFPEKLSASPQKNPRYFLSSLFRLTMSSSQVLRNLRDEPEEDDFDQLPLRKSVQSPRGKKPPSSFSSDLFSFRAWRVLLFAVPLTMTVPIVPPKNIILGSWSISPMAWFLPFFLSTLQSAPDMAWLLINSTLIPFDTWPDFIWSVCGWAWSPLLFAFSLVL